MSEKSPLNKIQSELGEGMQLAKCRKCGCMKDTLNILRFSVSSFPQDVESSNLLKDIERCRDQVEPIKYACLGCEYCFPAVAMNIFNQAYPEEAAQTQSLSCAFEVRDETWPPVPGEYFAFCEGPSCPVAVSTLGNVELAGRLAAIRPKELCIVGKTETENIGIEKVIKNAITNPTIQFLLLAGSDPKGHRAGSTFLALAANGVDAGMRVIGSPGKRPVLRNVNRQEVESFRKQVQVVDLIGCEDVETIAEKIRELSETSKQSCSCELTPEEKTPVLTPAASVLEAVDPATIEMDRAGYFVILPQPDKKIIVVEHYSYDNSLLRVIQGKNARSIYSTIIENGWVTQLSHAAYLGKELARAELSIEQGVRYVQDGA
jgi:tetrahydromethanopterin S-methyltransferase subunit A